MARGRSLAEYFLINRMFMFLLICLDSTKAAMGYYLLLGTVILINNKFADCTIIF